MIVTSLLAEMGLDNKGNELNEEEAGGGGRRRKGGGGDDDDSAEMLKNTVCDALKKRLAAALYGMMDASFEGDAERVKAMLMRGLDINAADYDNRTTLHLACAEGNTKVVELLTQEGCNVHGVDRYGNNALHYAVVNNHIVSPPRARAEHAAGASRREGRATATISVACASGARERSARRQQHPVSCASGRTTSFFGKAAPELQLIFWGRSGLNLGLDGARAKRARRSRRCCCCCSAAAEAGRIECASKASKTKKGLLLSVSHGLARRRRRCFCCCSSAAEAGRISGCRGETPRTPPTAGEVAHVPPQQPGSQTRKCARSHMCSLAYMLARKCARPRWHTVHHCLFFVCSRRSPFSVLALLCARFARATNHRPLRTCCLGPEPS
jgi:hypothetical protein